MVAARKLRCREQTISLDLLLIHTEQGDVARAATEAAALVSPSGEHPAKSHRAMEPHASVAVWRDGQLSLQGSYHSPVVTRDHLATVMRLKPSCGSCRHSSAAGSAANWGMGGNENTNLDLRVPLSIRIR
ncbi:molybdopterin-dependent oxidoreductase [Bradyrhizobium sp. 83012]|uniref:Molybdopterin-dependent oxidoreductase n=1 Tax=Bradyrhizobium aeschynomenes TaxID=2734909 RepID=A0ABX2CGE5_9BRAD|nr:molybdopterin-dependent oxidoreductase [Bradyrhizobium aeschynomenes]NPV20109.1 molybdopterin-dependent oxidoreductase [Bradyrhizobium aeschynomenes]